MNHINNSRWFCVILVLTVFLSAIAQSGCTRQVSPPPPLRVAINPWPGYSYLKLAEKLGYYRDAGVDIEIIKTGSLHESAELFAAGKVDGITSTYAELLYVDNTSTQRPQIVSIIDISNGLDMILARPGIASPNDLRGKTIAVEREGSGFYLLSRALESVGMTVADVKIVHPDKKALYAMIQAGEVDAVSSYPPISTAIQQSTEWQRIFSSADVPGEIIDVLSFSNKSITERTDDIKKIIDAKHQAMSVDLRSNSAALSIISHFSNATPEGFLSTAGGLVLSSGCEELDILGNRQQLRRDFQRTASAMQIKAGRVSREPSADEIVLYLFDKYCQG